MATEGKPSRQSRGKRPGSGRPVRKKRLSEALFTLSPDGTIRSWNAGAAEIYGYLGDEAVGRKLGEMIAAPELAHEIERLLSQAIKKGRAEGEAVHRRKDGSDIYVKSAVRAVGDESGRLSLLAMRSKDVTRRQVLDQGKLLESRYRGPLEAVPDAIVVVNAAGRIVLVNQQAEILFGYRRNELLGRPVETLLPERFRPAHAGHRTRYFLEPKRRAMGVDLELFAVRKDGGEFPVEISLSPLNIDDNTFAMSAIRDVSERKKLQEELQKKNQELEEQNRLVEQANRSKSEFLANMSHELRTPLNGIIGFAEIMYDGRVGPISEEHKEYLNDILTSARHLLQLINDILDLSKVEAGKFEFAPEQTDLQAIVAEVRDIVRTLVASRRIQLVIDVDPSLTGVIADPRSLKQILYNFLSNALKFTPEGGEVAVRVRGEGADFFRLEVQDTGIGIRAEDIGKLFREFQQLDTGLSRQFPGTGLGLALTKRIVEALGGGVGVESTPGKGSTFYAILPRRMGSAASDPESVETVAPGAPSILVVEDDVNDRAWIAGALRAAGYAVESVATGSEALARSRERRYEAITLDIMLPDMSGRAVLQRLRERGLNQQTPVIVVTVLPDKGVVAGFQVVDILSKPTSQSELLSALERCGVFPNAPRPVLVVDDDENSLRIADEMLRPLGYRTLCQADAARALEIATREPPAAVVLDLVMPKMSGFEFLARLRKTRRGRTLPVIVWTGKELTAVERAKLRRSASTVTQKSGRADALVREIRAVVPARRLRTN